MDKSSAASSYFKTTACPSIAEEDGTDLDLDDKGRGFGYGHGRDRDYGYGRDQGYGSGLDDAAAAATTTKNVPEQASLLMLERRIRFADAKVREILNSKLYGHGEEIVYRMRLSCLCHYWRQFECFTEQRSLFQSDDQFEATRKRMAQRRIDVENKCDALAYEIAKRQAKKV